MAPPEEPKGEQSPSGELVSYEPVTENSPAHQYYNDSYNYDSSLVATQPGNAAPSVEVIPAPAPAAPAPSIGGSGKKPPPPPKDPEDEEEEGMLRMSFLGHLEELRKRLFYMIIGVAVAFAISLTFSNQLWLIVQAPAHDALTSLHINPPNLSQITPMEAFNVIWFKLPCLVAVFMSSPWILYQVWAFIAPGLYKKERRFAAPFILFSAGLFILGGVFAYFVAFRFGITFLLGVGRDLNVTPLVSISEYFDLFVNVMLGIGVVFELPVIIFFLTLLRILSPVFLLRHSRYAILGIFVLSAVITPTPDIFNMMLFAGPMCLLFYLGIFASYLLVLKREDRKIPIKLLLLIILVVTLAIGALGYLAVSHYHIRFLPRWPFLTR